MTLEFWEGSRLKKTTETQTKYKDFRKNKVRKIIAPDIKGRVQEHARKSICK